MNGLKVGVVVMAMMLVGVCTTGAQDKALQSSDMLRTPKFKGCEANEQEVLTKAAIRASDAIDRALIDLREKGSATFVEWFGPYDYVRYRKVKITFERIRTNTSNHPIHAFCGDRIPLDWDGESQCKKDWHILAYVHGDMPFYIAICEAFFHITDIEARRWEAVSRWTACKALKAMRENPNLKLRESYEQLRAVCKSQNVRKDRQTETVLNYQAGTLLHELAHFDIDSVELRKSRKGRDDLELDAGKLQAFAKETPDDAIENPHSYQYYIMSFLPSTK